MAKRSNRNEILRANYKRLREAGFSSKEATRFRGASEAEIRGAINRKALPEIQEKKRVARLIKEISRKDYKQMQEINISLMGLKDRNFRGAYKEMKEQYKHGYRYYYIIVTFYFKDGNHLTLQSSMVPIADLKSIDQLKDEVTQHIETMQAKAYVERNNIVKVEVDIKIWRKKPKL